MTHGSLFSGIGGFDLAAEWMGWTNVFHCEFAEFPRKILHHYWPEAISYHDIKTADFTRHLGAVDIITGGFPCQPYSAAGKRKGKDDDRHLWPEMLRAIREVRPRWVVGENVFGITTWDGGVVLEEVCADLEAEGYAVQPFIIPACAVGAPHRRDRVWIVANATSWENNGHGSQRFQPKPTWFDESWIVANADSNRLQRSILTEQHRESFDAKEYVAKYLLRESTKSVPFTKFPTQPPICGGDDGLPRELDGITFPKWRNESIKAYGNAIVPQVARQIFQAIQKMEDTTP